MIAALVGGAIIGIWIGILPGVAAWGALMAWIAAQGLTPGEGLWECYAAGPETSPNPADWITELNCPVIDRP